MENKTIGKWISVKNKLPKTSGEKIVYMKIPQTSLSFFKELDIDEIDGYVTCAYYAKREGLWIINDEAYCANLDCVETDEIYHITHWMDFPEAPEE